MKVLGVVALLSVLSTFVWVDLRRGADGVVKSTSENPVKSLIRDCNLNLQTVVFDTYSGDFEKMEIPKFQGVDIVQIPGDLQSKKEIIEDIKPDIIVETGTYKGGSALYYASILKKVNPNGKIITIDISKDDVSPKLFQTKNIQFIHGDSVSKDIIEKVSKQVKGKKVLVTLDSSHEAAHVYRELLAYAPIVSLESYIIVQDTYIDTRWAKLKEPPIVAVRKYLKTNSNFQIDKSREKYYMTHFMDGFLKRVK